MTDRPRRKLDRILDPTYLHDLESIPTEELRAKKAECEELETEVSYARRLLQGKLDILRHGMKLGRTGSQSPVAALVEKLPAILAERSTTRIGRLPRIFMPSNATRLRRDAERLASEESLARIEELSPEELEMMLDRLGEAERETSQQRRRVQAVVDGVSAE
ncbi:MAG: hypothetical protein ACRDJK_01130, partial [Actinomycetota bacterium]